MKKFLAILLIPVFLLMTAGVAITSLYCNGKISEVGINVDACCKDVDKGGCCNTKTTIVKVSDAFVSAAANFELHKLIDLYLPEIKVLFIPTHIIQLSTNIHWDKGPPLIKGDLYLLFRSLLI